MLVVVMEYYKIVELGEDANGSYAFKDENDNLLSAVAIPNSVNKPFVYFYLGALGDDVWRRKVVMNIETVDGYTYAYPNIRRIYFSIYYNANIVSNTQYDETTMLKYYEWDMKFTNVNLSDTTTNFSCPIVYNQTVTLKKTSTAVTINNVEVPDKLKNGEWCHFKLVEKVLTDSNRTTCDLYIDDELFLEDVYVYQGNYNFSPNIVAYINLYGAYEDNPFDLTTDPCVLTANFKIYHQDTMPRKPMVKIVPEYGMNEVTLSYECVFDNATETEHEWFDSDGTSLGTDDSITIYENGVYTLTVTDTNGNNNTGFFVNTSTIFDIGCGSSSNNLSCGLTYYPDDWDFDKWKFEFDFTALVNEKKPMLYVVHDDEIRFEFGAVYCSDSENTIQFGNQYLNNKHHAEINVDTVNETLTVKIDDVLKGTFNTSFYPNEIRMSTENNGFNGVSYNFKLDNLKIIAIDD